MKNKTITLIASGILAASPFAPTALADGNNFITQARVLESSPIVETAYEQKEVCSYRYVTSTSRRGGGKRSNVGQKIVGGVLGGAAGSQVGKGSGQDAAAAVGAVLGSEVAAQDGELSGGELIGGIAGGIIGNQVGGGSGKTAATAAGALLGAIVGDELQNGPSRASAAGEEIVETRKKVRVCDVEEVPKKIITGYTVRYEYGGHQFSHITKRDPGAYLDISVGVDVLEGHTSYR